MAAAPVAVNQSQLAIGAEQGVVLQGNAHMKFVLDGRSVPGGSDHWNLEDHGFSFLSAQATSLSSDEFLQGGHTKPKMFKFEGQGYVASPASDDSWTSTYYREIANICKMLVPDAEAVHTNYHVLRKADLTFGVKGQDHLHKVAPKSDSEADRVVSEMLSVYQYIQFFPKDYKDRLGQQLHCDALGGVEAFLNETVTQHSKSKIENQYALMPEATPELIAEVSALLREDEYYDFVQRVRSMIPVPGLKGLNDFNVQPRNPDSQAEVVVSQMIAVLNWADLFPADMKAKLRRQLHTEGEQGVEDFIKEAVEAHSLPKDKNPHALMSKASPSLQAEVASLLSTDEYYSFVERSRCAFPMLDDGEVDAEVEAGKPDFQPPAVGGGHTDVSAEGFLNQFRQAFPEDHELSAVSPGCKRRVLFLKFWRNIVETPVVNHHLAMLDKGSIEDSDVHEHEINFKGMPIKQNLFNGDIDTGKLRWVYFPCMQKDEILCFQQGDLTLHASNGDSPQRVSFPELQQDHSTFHGAFEDPTAPLDAPPRQSIECAAFVFLPEEPDILARL